MFLLFIRLGVTVVSHVASHDLQECCVIDGMGRTSMGITRVLYLGPFQVVTFLASSGQAHIYISCRERTNALNLLEIAGWNRQDNKRSAIFPFDTWHSLTHEIMQLGHGGIGVEQRNLSENSDKLPVGRFPSCESRKSMTQQENRPIRNGASAALQRKELAGFSCILPDTILQWSHFLNRINGFILWSILRLSGIASFFFHRILLGS